MEIVRMKRPTSVLGYQQIKDRKADYYLQNKDMIAESRARSGDSKAGYLRQYYRENKDKIARRDGMRKAYYRQYYLQKKKELARNRDESEKKVDFRASSDESRSAYQREYYRGNIDKCAEYRFRNDGLVAGYLPQNYQDSKNSPTEISRIEYYRQYYHENKDHGELSLGLKDSKAEYINAMNASRADSEYRSKYYLENKDKSAEYRRGDGSRTDYHRQYSRGKREYARLFYGYQKTYLANNLDRKREYSRLYYGSRGLNQSWKTPEAIRGYFESIAGRLNISNIADWYRISKKQIGLHKGVSLYNKFGSLGAALQYAYPEIHWDLDVISTATKKKSAQRWLKLKIEELVPGIDIDEDYQHPELNWGAESERNVELDLWLPQHRIGVEYQGVQHYSNVDSFGPSSGTGSYSERDTLKNALCESRGITLVVIPYWWDGSVDSLSATLFRARPDVFPVSDAIPIPQIPFSNRENPAHIASHLKQFTE